jgi:hypothetical protein
MAAESKLRRGFIQSLKKLFSINKPGQAEITGTAGKENGEQPYMRIVSRKKKIKQSLSDFTIL